MQKLFFLLIGCLYFVQTNAQEKKPEFHGVYTSPLYKTISQEDMMQPVWHVGFEFLYKKSKSDIFHTKAMKDIQTANKMKSPYFQKNNIGEKKTRTQNPIIGTNFKGNELKSWTPTDNSMAISDSGMIVSCINYGIEYYDANGTNYLLNQTWDGFFNDPALNQAKFDPRVIYDPKHDRFVIVLLHGFSSATSKILICFSKTNNPVDGWNVYQLSGNPLQDTSWTDYPLIGINDDELFISGNRYGDAPSYNWNGAFIYQVDLQDGYNGNAISFGIWNNIYGPDNEDGFSVCPAPHGQGQSMSETMYFTHLRPDSGSHVYMYKISGKLVATNKSMTSTMYPIPHYDVCGTAFEKDPTTGTIDSLSSASAMVQNAFYNNGVVHFVFSADILSGWCGIHYGRILLDSNKCILKGYGAPGTDMSYPAIASFGYDTLDQSAVIAFLRSDVNITPECDVVGVNHQQVFSDYATVKAGDTVVNILYPPAYPVMTERWGDYTGIARRFSADSAEVWMAAAYGANTPPRLASYGTWIAQLKNQNAAVSAVNSPQRTISMKVYPNPVRDMFNLEFEAKQHAWVQVDLIDAQGNMIRRLFEDHVPESRCRLSFNKLVLPSGNYFVLVKEDGLLMKTEKVVVD
ncbi:MAG: T9SS type A sorting domain-containing protein [Chitinophagaceae bacterium]|nr:T9SS type A sorting domain-containing protein [Chitinophagaceae bacterium]